ncbi:hypothetical protein PENTCL1PPCAC_5771, partial [Pristionchus entomophagus]
IIQHNDFNRFSFQFRNCSRLRLQVIQPLLECCMRNGATQIDHLLVMLIGEEMLDNQPFIDRFVACRTVHDHYRRIHLGKSRDEMRTNLTETFFIISHVRRKELVASGIDRNRWNKS